ncbi:cation diffusion facilitator family transporter [Pseudomonadota bacterium]|nr:cation diffusion facilitator family transporter [Pseudomonadota bacterium]
MISTQHPNPERLMRWATYASVTTALLLISTKLIAWFVTDSVSILATLIDSSLDMLASVVNLIAVRHALQPADKEHRFGHGKAEALAGMGQSMFIAGSAGVLLLQAIERMIHPKDAMTSIDVGLGVMIFSMLATAILITFQSYVIKHTDSTAIKADALHYKTDLWVNGSVIIALVLTLYNHSYFDAIIALGIALFVLYSAWEIVQESIDLLMDHELPNEERNKIKEIVSRHPKTIGCHDLRTRRSGTMIFIQFHLELDASLSLFEAHSIADSVEQRLKSLFLNVEIIIHEDPVITHSS